MVHIKLEEMGPVLGHLLTWLRTIEDLPDHAGPLMENWERIIIEDNMQGVLRGVDKDENLAPPLTYRPIERGVKLTVAQRLGQPARKKRGEFAGRGSYTMLGLQANNNLTTKEYQMLDGPRLAPRRQFSRVISNLMTGHGQRVGYNTWEAVCAWVGVVTKDGLPFLHYHFNGDGNNPKYDLRGIRSWGRVEMMKSLREWAKDEIRKGYIKAT